MLRQLTDLRLRTALYCPFAVTLACVTMGSRVLKRTWKMLLGLFCSYLDQLSSILPALI